MNRSKIYKLQAFPVFGLSESVCGFEINDVDYYKEVINTLTMRSKTVMARAFDKYGKAYIQNGQFYWYNNLEWAHNLTEQRLTVFGNCGEGTLNNIKSWLLTVGIVQHKK